jgi:hypothetical protein
MTWISLPIPPPLYSAAIASTTRILLNITLHLYTMPDDDYDPTQDDDVASDHLDDDNAPGPSKRKTAAGGAKDDVSQVL